MNAAHFIALFGLSCAANSLLAWLAAVNPAGHDIGKAIYVLLCITLFAALMMDDFVAPILGLDQLNYYGFIASIVLSMLLGSGLIWLAPQL